MPDAAQALYPGGPSSMLGNDYSVGDENFTAAHRDLNLTPEEQALYKRHLTNLTGKGGVDNPDGSRSSLFASTFEVGDKTYVLPTVWDGKIVDAKTAFKNAKAEGLDKFPSYGSEEEASQRYDKMHSYMEKDTAKYLAGRNQ